MSNNEHFNKLAEILQERFEIDQEQLIDALFIIRAHYSLAGIVVVCQHLNELIETYPELRNGALLKDLDDRLLILNKIAKLHDAPGHFIEDTIDKNQRNETPLRPYTGDSSICDLLLIQPQSIESEHNKLFEWVSAWFTWQTFYFQEKIHSPQLYRDYLLGSGNTNLNEKNGSRIYGAFLALRQLGDVENFETLKQVKYLLQNINKESSIKAADNLEEKRKQDAEIEDKILYHIGLFLSQLWHYEDIKSSSGGKSLISSIKRKQKKLGLRRYGKAHFLLQRIDDDDIHSGLISEIYRQDNEDDKNEELLTGDKDLNDEPTELSVEPEVLLFLSEGKDLLQGFYAAKSALHHIDPCRV